MNYTYDLQRINNYLYVSVEPLMNDIKESVRLLDAIDTTDFNEKDKELLDLKIKGLATIYSFLGALLQEEALRELKETQ